MVRETVSNRSKSEAKRDEKGLFQKGTAPGPGRPQGQTLKEYWRARFKEMTDDEKLAFTKYVGNETIWKMAEGQPAQETDITSGGKELEALTTKTDAELRAIIERSLPPTSSA